MLMVPFPEGSWPCLCLQLFSLTVTVFSLRLSKVFRLFYVDLCRKRLESSFPGVCACPAYSPKTICWRSCLFLKVYFCILSNIMWLYLFNLILAVVFHSIDLCIYFFCLSTTLLLWLWLWFRSWNQIWCMSSVVHFAQNQFGYLESSVRLHEFNAVY